MIWEFGVTPDPSRVGFYSGLVDSVFSIAQLFSIYHLARLSDSIGRKPVIYMGITGIAIATLLFGTAQSLFGILASRFVAGLLSGNLAVIHSVLAEITDETNQAIAFPIYGLCWPLGGIIGPLIGGSFSKPVEKFPAVFGSSQFLAEYPYFLPCAIAASISLTSVILGLRFLEETLPSKRLKSSPKLERKATSDFIEPTSTEDLPALVVEEKPTMRSLLGVHQIYWLCVSGFALQFVGGAFDVVFVLFCYSPIELGGLQFSTTQIGYALSTAGFSSALMQVLLMPTLYRRFDCAILYKGSLMAWPFCFAILPLLNYVATLGLQGSQGEINDTAKTIIWIGVAFVLALSRVGCMAYSVSMLLVKNAAPNSASLGSSNGLVQFSMCLARAISPAFVSSMFALSVEHNLLGGLLWVVVMVVLSVWSISVGLPLKEGVGKEKIKANR